MEDINAEFWTQRIVSYAQPIKDKDKSMQTTNCVGFIDGPVLEIERPRGDPIMEEGFCNGRKQKNGFKYQEITSPFGLLMHLCGPMEARSHE